MIDTLTLKYSKPAERFISAKTARAMAESASGIAVDMRKAANDERRKKEKGGADRIKRLSEKADLWQNIAAELMEAAIADDEAEKPQYRSELTEAGERLVIPGCELDQAPGCKQGSLF